MRRLVLKSIVVLISVLLGIYLVGFLLVDGGSQSPITAGKEQFQTAKEMLEKESAKYDPQKAIALLHLASENMNYEAMHQLGLVYWQGIHVTRDPVKSLNFVGDALFKGRHIAAIKTLGDMYADPTNTEFYSPGRALAYYDAAKQLNFQVEQTEYEKLKMLVFPEFCDPWAPCSGFQFQHGVVSDDMQKYMP